MHKVMTRNGAMTRAERPGTRPPVRHDTRRPGGTPRRTRTTPDQSTSRTTPGPGASRVLPGAGTSPTAAGERPSRTAAGAPSPHTPAVAGGSPGQAVVGAPLRPVPHVRPTDVFADRLLSVLSGQRPVHSMLRHTVGRAYDELAWLARRGPLRTRGTARPVVRDIGYYVPRPGAIEAFARIGAGDQLRAMAFRLECGLDHRWRCTAVELGGSRMPPADDD
ncbi:Rv3235 family protein [Streptomyces colonosanans]|uniref:Uncharacterized protein n=1 Tax=Streptomyces colonosanans TaxID=1428652 RepID=A0A1S2NZS1_9ACTN|nr:Rv3235 family protein [Streptomyces colonosanans]OIJ86973.1 hypothetical protein BIV24_25385 [Streptomyces colonosanans]